MEEINNAISHICNPQTEQVDRQNALQYLKKISELPHSWKIFMEKLSCAENIQVAVICLSIIQDFVLTTHLELSTQEKREIRENVLAFLSRLSAQNSPRIIQNALALLITHIFKLEYLSCWHSFFFDISSILLANNTRVNNEDNLVMIPRASSVSMWLCILNTIHEEVVSNEVYRNAAEIAQNNAIKDLIRDSYVNELVSMFCKLLVIFSQEINLVQEMLNVFANYVHWIDISLIFNSKIFGLLFELVQIPEYFCPVFGVFQAILAKGMQQNPMNKLNVIKALKIDAILDNENFLQTLENRKIAASVTNSLGVELLKCQALLKEEAKFNLSITSDINSILEHTLKIMFKLLNDEDDEVLKNSLDFIQNYVFYLKTLRKNDSYVSSQHIHHIQILVQVLCQKMQYKQIHQVNSFYNDNQEFDFLRRDLSRLFVQLFEVEFEFLITYTNSLIESIYYKENIYEIEMALYCLFSLGELKTNVANTTNTCIIQMIQKILNTKIWNLQYSPCITQYFRCLNRYSRLLASLSPNLIPVVLAHWMQEYGIFHPNPLVKTCHTMLFCQFAKSLRAQLQPFLDEIVKLLKPLVNLDYQTVESNDFEEKLSIIEILGLLIGLESNNEKHKIYFNELVAPILQNLKHAIHFSSNDNQAKSAHHFLWIIMLIKSIATFSKGFVIPPKNKSAVVENYNSYSMEFFGESSQVFVKIFTMPSLLEKDEVLSACFYYVEHIVLRVGVDHMVVLMRSFFNFASQILDVVPMTNFISVLNKILSFYKVGTIYSYVNLEFSKIILTSRRLLEHLEQIVTPSSDEEKSLIALKKALYTFINLLISNNFTQVFYSNENIANLGGVLSFLVQGSSSSNMSIQKASFSSLGLLVRQWLEPTLKDPNLPPEISSNFVLLLRDQIIPTSYQITQSESFDLNDAKSLELINELVTMEKILFETLGDQYESYLINEFFPNALKVNQQIASQYVCAVKEASTCRQKTKIRIALTEQSRGNSSNNVPNSEI